MPKGATNQRNWVKMPRGPCPVPGCGGETRCVHNGVSIVTHRKALGPHGDLYECSGGKFRHLFIAEYNSVAVRVYNQRGKKAALSDLLVRAARVQEAKTE